MQFLSFFGLIAAIIPATLASCPSSSQYYYIQSVSNGNYSVTGPSTDVAGPPYAQVFKTKSQADATQYAFFKNATANICQLTFAGTAIKGHPNANQSIFLNPTKSPGSTYITEVLIGPQSSEAGSKAFTVVNLACGYAKGSYLACSATTEDGTYSTLSMESTGQLLISNQPKSAAQKFKLVPVVQD